MKKVMKLLSVICALVLVLSCAVTANAARPTALTITEVAKAPVIDGVIDNANGPMQWNQTASDIPVGEYDLFPRTKEECAPFMELYKFMNMKGYLTYDKEGIYIAVEATDLPPKAAPNSNQPWKSTNIQIVLYTNSSRNFFTVAYSGTNKANIFNDETRSELEIEKVKDYCVKEKVEGNKATLVWELKIPYGALWDVKSMDDIDDMRLGIVQSSMSADISGYDNNIIKEPYACQAFGKAYSLVYDDLLVVKTAPLKSNDSTTSKEETTNNDQSASKVESTSNEQTTNKEETSNSKPEDAGTTNEIVSATGDGVDFGATEDDTTVESTETNSEADKDATGTVQEDNSKTTLIIILAAVAGVIVIGGVVAIILINKK